MYFSFNNSNSLLFNILFIALIRISLKNIAYNKVDIRHKEIIGIQMIYLYRFCKSDKRIKIQQIILEIIEKILINTFPIILHMI